MKKTENIIFAACSAVKEEPATNALWFQTFPAYGRYAVGGIIKDAPADAEFVFDEAAAKEIIANFRAEAKKPDWPGILVDREHFSADREKTSDAMAWAKDIRQEKDGSIWTRWEFTAVGRDLWQGKVLVNRSPLFACRRDGKDYIPVALKSIGMTNTPHFTELSTLAAARGVPARERITLEGLVAKARTDANGMSHGEDGRFDGGNGSTGIKSSDTPGGDYTSNLKNKLHKKWLKDWDEIDKLNDLFDTYANAEGAEREKAGNVMRKKFAELNALGIVKRNPGEGRAFKHSSAPSREYIMKDDEWEKTGRRKYSDPTSRLMFTTASARKARLSSLRSELARGFIAIHTGK